MTDAAARVLSAALATAAGLLFALCGCGRSEVGSGPVVRAGSARFTLLTPECVRIERSSTRRFVDEPSLFAGRREPGTARFRAVRDGDRYTLDTGRIRIEYVDDGKPLTESNLRAAIQGGAGPIVWTPGRRNDGNLGGTLKALGGVRGPVDLGEGVLSRAGWYLLDDSKGPLFTADGWVRERPADAGTDWYLFGYGQDYHAALRALTAAGGEVPMPRRYALGSWYSWYWPLRSDDYRRIVREYAEHDVPLDVMVMDTDWHAGGWTGWTWNRDLLPDAESLLAWFHQQGLAVTLNTHPAGGVPPREAAFAPFMRALGADPGAGRPLPFDATDRRYLDAWFRFTHEPLEKAGADFFWIDWQQWPMTRGVAGLSNLAWLNDRYYRRSERDGMRGQILSRWAGWGDHRNPMHFSGDAEGRWAVLQFEVPFTATAGNVGCFFWSHDIGGHRGDRDQEAFTRWVQFGALSAALRLHSTRAASLDRRPWSYDTEFEQAMQAAFRLRAALFPYIYSSVHQSHEDSIPLLRPVYLEAPGDERAYSNPQEYLLGDALLVAPITTPGEGKDLVATQAVWFPPGRWRDFATGEPHEGGEELIVAAGLNEIPIFVRDGVPLPMQAPGRHMGGDPPAEIRVRCMAGGAGRFTLYEDDGVSTAYRNGAFATTGLACARAGDKVTVTIDPPQGTYRGQPEHRSYVVELPGTLPGCCATVDGEPANVEYDASTLTNRVRVAERPMARGARLEIAAPEAGDATRHPVAARRGASADATRPSGVLMHRKREGLYLLGGADFLLLQDREGLSGGIGFLTVEERAGDATQAVLRQSVTFSPGGLLRLPLPPFPRMESPPAGVPLLRTARLEMPLARPRAGEPPRPMTAVVMLDRLPSFLLDWSVAGPFPYDETAALASQRFGPEAASGPAAPDLAAAFEGAGGAPVAWTGMQARDDGTVDLRAAFDFDRRLAYGVTFLESRTRQPVLLKVWSDDGIEIWLNGVSIHLNDVVRALDVGPDLVRATLAPGRNVLLVKVANSVQGWGYRVELEAKEGVTARARSGG